MLEGWSVPGTPIEYNRAAVLRWRIEGAAPRVVLVLSPGFSGGAGLFRRLAPAIVERTAGAAEVWVIDRRSNFLEDRSGFLEGERRGDPAVPLYYYLAPGGGWNRLKHEDVPWMAGWGLEVALEDIRCVLTRAHRERPGARVVLGGHSLGGMLSQAYAAAEFRDGMAGWTDIDGILLIDGCMRGPKAAEFRGQGAATYGMLRKGLRFWEDWERIVAPEVAIAAGIAAMAAVLPEWGTRMSILKDAIPQLGAHAGAVVRRLTHAGRLTNRALFGLLVDDLTAPSAMARAHVGFGIPMDGSELQPLLDWCDGPGSGEPGDIAAYASLLRHHPDADGMEWYCPIRLNADLDMLQDIDSENVPVASRALAPDFIVHNASVAVPILAIVNLDHPGGEPEHARWYRSSVASSDFTIVPAAGYAHMDPLVARPEENVALDAAVEWTMSRFCL